LHGWWYFHKNGAIIGIPGAIITVWMAQHIDSAFLLLLLLVGFVTLITMCVENEHMVEPQWAGLERLFHEYLPVQRDAAGELYRMPAGKFPDVQRGDRLEKVTVPLVAVKVIDPHTGRQRFIRVPPWVTRARQGVAWTFQVPERLWTPELW